MAARVTVDKENQKDVELQASPSADRQVDT